MKGGLINMKTILKKAVSSFIAAFMAAGFLSVPFMGSALETATLSVTSVKGEPGKDVIVSVNISSNSGLGAMDFIVKYDNAKLLYKSYQIGAAAEGGFLSVNPNYKNQDGTSALKQAFIHPEGLIATGPIVELTFTIAPGWTGSTTVTLEVIGDISQATPPYNKIPHESKNGTVTIGSASGGVNNDGTAENSVETNAAGETVSAQSTNGDTTTNTDSAASAGRSISRGLLTIVLSVCGILLVGGIAAFVIKKKK